MRAVFLQANYVTPEDWLEQPGHSLLTPADEAYPPLLRDTPSPPAHLYVAGNADVLSLPQLAIVGSRNATPGGLDAAHEFARYLAGCGLTITSGLALGVDAAAHAGALAAHRRQPGQGRVFGCQQFFHAGSGRLFFRCRPRNVCRVSRRP